MQDMDREQLERVENIGRKIDELTGGSEITLEISDKILHYVFFKTITIPGVVSAFNSARGGIPDQFRFSADETKRNLVTALLFYIEGDMVRNRRGTVFEMMPENYPREYRFATDFDISVNYGRGHFHVPRGVKKGKFIPYLDVYRWLDTLTF